MLHPITGFTIKKTFEETERCNSLYSNYHPGHKLETTIKFNGNNLPLIDYQNYEQF